MRQYQQFKSQHPDYILFFRMGDFYEMFWDDARIAARVLGVTLTSRSRGGVDAEDAIPMAGVPFHAVESYLRKMIAAGHKVALCEQMEDAALAKGVVKREVVRLMTPGTLTDEALLDGRTENYVAAIGFGITKRDGFKTGLAWIELSTGAVVATSNAENEILEEIARIKPAEVLIPEQPSGEPHSIGERIKSLGINAVTVRPGWQFTPHHAAEQLNRQWKITAPAGIGFEADDPGLQALAAVLSYLQETQKTGIAHLRTPRRHDSDQHLALDPASYRSLEIDRTLRSGQTEGSLLSAIDRTRTSMGGRLLRQWLRFPLNDREHIETRQNAVATLLASPGVMSQLAEKLDDICDIERVVGRLAVSRVGPRDLAALRRCLASLPTLVDLLAKLPAAEQIAPELVDTRQFCVDQHQYLLSAILPDPAPHLREGGVINQGFDAELDRLQEIATNSAQWLANYQAKLAQESGIATLKVGYNKVFGYYIEVTETNREKAQASWIRKQTVKNAERYITPELKEFETEALGARDRSIALEQQLFESIRTTLLPHVEAFQELAATLARVDVLVSFAILASERRYCRPTITDERVLEIIDGRHPVLEQQLGDSFVSNDVRFGERDDLQLITGPNMAGKSTFIRQVALITLMAQIGSYVPAGKATIGLVDRIFTRIGASDELHSGQSTFMVEMVETANILNNATDRSLVILDEIGRGTSTLDGLSLAWAIAEHLAGEIKCRALFATHYHELTDLAERFGGVKNLNVAVREWEDQVIFLHRIVEGGTDRSYGIHVARLAGVPGPVLQRARQLLGELMVQHVAAKPSRRGRKAADENQMPLFTDPSASLAGELANLDLDSMSPKEAFAWLQGWHAKLSPAQIGK